MAQFRSQNVSPGYDPAPNVATPAEIRLAEELRRRLEERYLSGSSRRAASVARHLRQRSLNGTADPP